MNRKERRQKQREQHAYVKKLPSVMTPIPSSEWPEVQPRPIGAWISRKYLAQLYDERSREMPGLMRLSVSRSTVNATGRWMDAITWDELQAIKREIGLGDCWAYEVYPPDFELVNDANLRHLWVTPAPLPIGWCKS